MKRLLLIALPLYALDQVTKHLVLWYVPLYEGRELVPGLLNLVHYTNTGAAFGAVKDNNAIFIVLSFVTLAALAFYFVAISGIACRRPAWPCWSTASAGISPTGSATSMSSTSLMFTGAAVIGRHLTSPTVASALQQVCSSWAHSSRKGPKEPANENPFPGRRDLDCRDRFFTRGNAHSRI